MSKPPAAPPRRGRDAHSPVSAMGPGSRVSTGKHADTSLCEAGIFHSDTSVQLGHMPRPVLGACLQPQVCRVAERNPQRQRGNMAGRVSLGVCMCHDS